jgi:hypothetical protein
MGLGRTNLLGIASRDALLVAPLALATGCAAAD